jgi:hypothetical protein
MLCTHAFPIELLRTGSSARARDSAVRAQMHFVSLCTEVDFSPGRPSSSAPSVLHGRLHALQLCAPESRQCSTLRYLYGQGDGAGSY